jgi:hypothetical protein
MVEPVEDDLGYAVNGGTISSAIHKAITKAVRRGDADGLLGIFMSPEVFRCSGRIISSLQHLSQDCMSSL